MDAITLVVTVVFVTASGALALGPLLFATISHGTRLGVKSGLMFAIGHTLIEFALVMALASGLLTVANEPIAKVVIGIAGGIVLIAFGALQIRSSLLFRPERVRSKPANTRNLLFIGLAFTGLNPFFIVWWLTVGSNLILISLEFASIAGVIFMYVCHVWMDYVWLMIVAHLARVGTNIAGFKWYRLVLALFGVILIYFGFTFIVNSIP
jgi:threonine/homoserine/homoserine lactone efflux protein